MVKLQKSLNPFSNSLSSRKTPSWFLVHRARGKLGRCLETRPQCNALQVDATCSKSMKFPCGSRNLIRYSGQFFRQFCKQRVTQFYTATDNDPDMAAAATEHYNFPKEEEKILELWKKLDVFKSSLEQSKDRPR